MKTIELNLPLLNMDSNPILKDNQEQFLNRDALTRILGEVGVATQVTGDVKLRAYQLGIKIRGSGDQINFDNHDDFDFIKEQVKNSQSFGSVVIGQLLEYLNQTNLPKTEEILPEEATPEADDSEPVNENLEVAS